MRRSKREEAFTLTELLIVIGIILVLAAILIPVIGAARKRVDRHVATSNLKQIGYALAIYSGQWGDDLALPPRETIREVLDYHNAPTWDPSDYWRSSRDEEWGDPLVGSYAYARMVVPTNRAGEYKYDYQTWFRRMSRATNPPIMVSIFHRGHVKPFHGIVPDIKSNPFAYDVPDRFLRLRLDTSVQFEQTCTFSERQIFTRYVAFERTPPCEWVTFPPPKEFR